ncbi:MAG: TetR/AcrR family transcriptional regulator [Deltaproteobacteria bacterium]|nr:TetR/AcrR family transcriptional regulator [Deltaproteobacteria bacterium]
MAGPDPGTEASLIGAAVTMFQEKGFQKTRVSDVVSMAGVSQGTFYNYFKSKEEIFRHICNGFIAEVQKLFIERTEHIFDGDSATEIRKNVLATIDELFVIYMENLAVAEILFREGIGNGGLFKEIYEDLLSIFIDLIREQVEKGVEKGFLTTDDPGISAVFIFGLFERSLFYFLLVRRNTDLKVLRDMLADFILKGLSLKED